MISKKTILKHAPSVMDEQVHVNHEDCPSGKDTKRRLYIKKTSRGFLAYCHHCNEKGFASLSGEALSSSSFFKTTYKASKAVKLPTLVELTIAGRIWLNKHFCDPSEHCFNGVRGEPNKVALDLFDKEGEHIGYQVRNLDPNATPKYLTHYFDVDNKGAGSWFYKEGSKTLVLTVDYLSAYRVNRDAPNCSSIALLRTAISEKLLLQIYESDFNQIIVWLDPDSAGVEGAAKAYKKLQHFLPTSTKVLVYGVDKEPKQLTPKELHNGLLSVVSLL